MGFDAEWGVVSAADTGAPHLRERIWILADANSNACGAWRPNYSQQRARGRNADRGHIGTPLADANRRDELGRDSDVQMGRIGVTREIARHGYPRGIEWPVEPGMGRVVDGVAHRMDRVKALGNGQVPRVAAAAFTILKRK
jgi:DNA (cytosine-5)-methyltransferase 1